MHIVFVISICLFFENSLFFDNANTRESTTNRKICIHKANDRNVGEENRKKGKIKKKKKKNGIQLPTI